MKRSRCDEIVLDGWMDRCECPKDAKGPYAAQAKKERAKKKKGENAVKYVDGKRTEKDKMDSSALKQMHAGVSIVISRCDQVSKR